MGFPFLPFIFVETRKGHIWGTYSHYSSCSDSVFFYLTIILVVALPLVPRGYSFCPLHSSIMSPLMRKYNPSFFEVAQINDCMKPAVLIFHVDLSADFWVLTRHWVVCEGTQKVEASEVGKAGSLHVRCSIPWKEIKVARFWQIWKLPTLVQVAGANHGIGDLVGKMFSPLSPLTSHISSNQLMGAYANLEQL